MSSERTIRFFFYFFVDPFDGFLPLCLRFDCCVNIEFRYANNEKKTLLGSGLYQLVTVPYESPAFLNFLQGFRKKLWQGFRIKSVQGFRIVFTGLSYQFWQGFRIKNIHGFRTVFTCLPSISQGFRVKNIHGFRIAITMSLYGFYRAIVTSKQSVWSVVRYCWQGLALRLVFYQN
jgi:hypothetical protein